VRRRLSICLALVLGTIALFAVVPSAFAWKAEQTTNGWYLTREAADTATSSVTVYRYWDYKGGDSTWTMNNGGNVPGVTTSYNSSDYLALGSTVTNIEIPYKSGYVFQAIRVVQSGPADVYFCAMNKGTRLGNPNSQTAGFLVTQSSVPTTPVSMVETVPVSFDQSISIDSTVTAEPTLPAGPSRSAWRVGVCGLFAFCGFVAGRSILGVNRG